MSYQVLNDFVEKEHDNITYNKDEVYPKAGFKADPARVAYLQSDGNKYRKAFLGSKIEKDSAKKSTKK